MSMSYRKQNFLSHYPNLVYLSLLEIRLQQLCYLLVSLLMFRSNNEGREIPVGKSNLLLRGCIIRNTDWAEGMVVYAGKEML